MIATPMTEDTDTPTPTEYMIDFDKIIPEPKVIEDCPANCIVNEDSHIEKYEDRPWFDWYTWHNEYWGTKWNAYDGYTIVGKTHITFVFNTAWSFAFPVIEKLKLFGYDIDVKYADEDYGSNCGRLTYRSEQGWRHQDETTIPNPQGFARMIWDNH